MTLMLGIDTATSATAVALVEHDGSGDGLSVLAEARHDDPRRHGEVLPPLIQQILASAAVAISDVGSIAVGVGPGAYTGLRVGLATAEALALATGADVHGVVTLDAFAFGSGRTEPFAMVTDARRREVFLAEYDDWRSPSGAPVVLTPDAARVRLDQLSTAGGSVVAPAGTPALPGIEVAVCSPLSARDTCGVAVDRLQRGMELVAVRPLYLRTPDVTPAAATKSVLS